MKPNEMDVIIARREGHRSQARIYDIKEVKGIIADLMYESAAAHQCMIKLGIDRAKRRKKK
jgi:hypothetical protein